MEMWEVTQVTQGDKERVWGTPEGRTDAACMPWA